MERSTFQKNIILDTLSKNRNHPTAEDLYNEIHINYPNISKATVYRNLKNMANAGIIKKLEISDTFDRYDFYDSHYHAKCVLCNNIIDLDLKYQDELNELVSKEYLVLSHDILFKIFCNDCKKEMKKNE